MWLNNALVPENRGGWGYFGGQTWTSLNSFHSTCSGVCFFFGFWTSLWSRVQLSIHLIKPCFPTKRSLVCHGVVHRMDLFPRGAWNTWKHKIPSVEILAKNPTRSCLGLFMGREISESKLLAIQWLKTEQQDGNDEILTSLCSSNKYFSGN